MDSRPIMPQAMTEAKELIRQLKEHHNLDYTKHWQQLALEIWDEGLWEGNSDITVCVDSTGKLPDLRVIQEDHYDQHMDEEENKPTWKSMLFSNPEYTWFANKIN